MIIGSSLTFAVIAAVCAAVFTFIAIPVMMPFLQRHALAKVTSRSSHKVPTPQGAGIAIVISMVAVFGIAIFFAPFSNPVFTYIYLKELVHASSPSTNTNS